jgi:short-subunit dehydrogenase
MSHPALKLYHKEAYPAISPHLPALSQTGKTIVVSGASSGIGLSIARSFVAAGAVKVILLGRRQDVLRNAADGLNRASGRSAAEGRAVDVYDPTAIDELWSTLEAENVYVDVLVLSAAAFGKSIPILKTSFASTWGDFEANVRGPLAMTLNFAKQTTGNRKKVWLNYFSLAFSRRD